MADFGMLGFFKAARNPKISNTLPFVENISYTVDKFSRVLNFGKLACPYEVWQHICFTCTVEHHFQIKSKIMKKNNDSQVKNNTGATKKKSSALAAAARGERATDNVRARSTRDINGASGMKDTGTNVSYEDKE